MWSRMRFPFIICNTLVPSGVISNYVHVFFLIQIVWGLDQVTLLNPPEEPVSDHLLEILYSCDQPATVQLDCIVSFDTGITSTLLLRQWSCLPDDPKIRTLELNLPDWLVYQADGIVPDSQWVLSCILMASVRHSGFDDTERSVAAQDVATLQPRPFFNRPVKQHPLCIAWSTQMLQLTQQFSKKQCPLEQETVLLLSSIYASTGEGFGITKTLDPYSSELLEYLRLKAISFPWCMFSIWVFVTSHCQKRMCGLFYHIDPHNNYITPTLFLTNSGQLHVQVSAESEEASAFLSPFKVPLSEWCQISVTLHGRMVSSLSLTEDILLSVHTIMLDDTEGYFVIGGGKYIRGVEGYYGPLVYYRNRISPHSPVNTAPAHCYCQCRPFATFESDRFPLLQSEVVIPDVIRSVNLTGWLQTCVFYWVICSETIPVVNMSNFLYSLMPLCVVQAWLLALLGAQKDDRLALLHLGHLHHQGLHGLPTDPDLAYAYYANIAKQTTLDRLNPTPQQTFVEAIYLNNDEVLNVQTNEDHHIFQWLKLQARRGATEAEQAIGRMLFWGQQGVTPDIQKAVRHYERGAVQWEDPVSMYDYGIVLLEGHGVKKDIPKAVTFLKKAMDQGFVPAINALAWYYERFEQDYKQAVQLWEQADLLNCPDAALNLGVCLEVNHLGHIRGAVQLAEMWTTGIPGHVNRRPSDAVLWVKWTAEHNGYLGSVLRKALDSYLKNDISLLYYMMAAECGYAAAQFNVAYLCEQNTVSYLYINCTWRYYNLTIQSQNPDTYALIKMGDLLYEGHSDRQKDCFSAAEMYMLAALRNEPQGWYNLGLLSEEGYRLPLSVLTELGLSELYLADKSLLLSALYKRCVCVRAVDCFQHKSVRKIILYFLPKDAETQKIQIRICLAALPSSVCIFSLSIRTIVLLLRLV
uniref:Si:dkey-24p1.6 n=1 Tax=Dicentrarchus labrax TaxID=13489 RepID=A0A8P4K9E1_DICLA